MKGKYEQMLGMTKRLREGVVSELIRPADVEDLKMLDIRGNNCRGE